MTIKNEPSFDALDTMSPSDLARLPGGILLGIQAELDSAKELLKKREAVFFAACEQRYGASARDLLAKDGRESGVVHIPDGDLVVDVEAKKSIVWDQKKLADLWDLIRAGGDDPTVYIRRELKVSETAFKGWSEQIQDAFTPARTVKSGKPTFRIKGSKP